MTIPVTELRKVEYHYRKHPDFWRGWRRGKTTARTQRMDEDDLRQEIVTLTRKAERMMAQPMSNLARCNILYTVGMAEAFDEVLTEVES